MFFLILLVFKNNKIKLGDILLCIILFELEFIIKFNFVIWSNFVCLVMELLSIFNRNGIIKTDNFFKSRLLIVSAGD